MCFSNCVNEIFLCALLFVTNIDVEVAKLINELDLDISTIYIRLIYILCFVWNTETLQFLSSVLATSSDNLPSSTFTLPSHHRIAALHSALSASWHPDSCRHLQRPCQGSLRPHTQDPSHHIHITILTWCLTGCQRTFAKFSRCPDKRRTLKQ